VEINNKMTEALKLIDETVKTVRRIATQLRPSILDDLGLISAMEWQSEEFEKRFKIKTSFISDTPVVQVESEIATGLSGFSRKVLPMC
jgi:signal transduction histidine kinase